MILTFIVMNFLGILFKGSIELAFLLKDGPCSAVIKDLTQEWDDEFLFGSKTIGALFKYEYSNWNAVVMIFTALIAQLSSVFLRKKSFGYEKLEPSRSFTLN